MRNGGVRWLSFIATDALISCLHLTHKGTLAQVGNDSKGCIGGNCIVARLSQSEDNRLLYKKYLPTAVVLSVALRVSGLCSRPSKWHVRALTYQMFS